MPLVVGPVFQMNIIIGCCLQVHSKHGGQSRCKAHPFYRHVPRLEPVPVADRSLFVAVTIGYVAKINRLDTWSVPSFISNTT